MIAPRRFLPSIPSLLALEAVDRLGTATAAAEELALTHSAVSRQLKVLEEQIGVEMLRREGKGLALTPAGVTYAGAIREALHDIARASLKIRAGGSRSSLNLAVLPSFGAYWLSPRLRGFTAEHGELILNMATRLGPFDFAREKFDAAIHYGRRDWQGVNYLPLLEERVVPACAPGFLAQPATTAADLLTLPLLHLESRPAPGRSGLPSTVCNRPGCAACCSTSSSPWPKRRSWVSASRSCRSFWPRAALPRVGWCRPSARPLRLAGPIIWSGRPTCRPARRSAC